MTLNDVFNRFNTTPFLFIGSGLTRRYLGLPNWQGLLNHFVKIINTDPFAYRLYESRAESKANSSGTMPQLAELLQRDFDEKWYTDPSIRSVNESRIADIQNKKVSPFKAEIAQYIENNSKERKKEYAEEILLLSNLSRNSIAGIITTNYDTFLEDCFEGYVKYIGQRQLIFSAIQGIAEIYKIHGSIEEPNSIIINSEDYEDFESKKAYLAAKLLTIFMEYPIVFIGYSISDTNIQNIMHAIVNCLTDEQLYSLKDRFIFVEYKASIANYEISTHSISFDMKQLPMTKITLSDYRPLYREMAQIHSTIPVRLLRRFKDELYNYVVTNTPTSVLRVASIEDERIEDEELVLAIGRADELGLKGLSGIKGNEWYRNIILEDLHFTADELLEYAYEQVYRDNSAKIPLFKYLAQATKSFPSCQAVASTITFDSIIPKSFSKQKKNIETYSSVKEVWENEKNCLERATRYIALLNEDSISSDELFQVLVEIFDTNIDVLLNGTAGEKTNIRRLIRVYDYLKWGKKSL